MQELVEVVGHLVWVEILTPMLEYLEFQHHKEEVAEVEEALAVKVMVEVEEALAEMVRLLRV